MDTLKIAEPLNPLAFILNNNILSENGSPIEFRDHYFLIDPYVDMTPEQVVCKPSQIGWSTLGINKALWLAKYKKANIIYTLPSKSIVKDFVMPKVDPIIIQNPIYNNWLGKTDSVALKAVEDRFIYFRGSWEELAAISISANILINDEADRSNQKVLSTYTTRLDDAKRERPDLGFIWQWSNPSIPGYGVDESWQHSDQKHWFIKCPHCNSEFYLKYPDNINFQTEHYICTNCQKTLTDNDRRNGRWVKKFTNREISGYWLSQMMVPWISAKDIIKKSKGDKSIFHNFCLGLPYISADESVSRKTITDCIIPTVNPRTHVVIGVDNGVVKTVVVGNVHGIFKIYQTEDWGQIEADLIKYNATMVIDSNPYPTRPKQLAVKYPGRVFSHWFVQEQKDLQIIRWGEGDKDGTVVSDRTKLIDMVISELKNQEIIFNLTITELEQFIHECSQLYRTIEENSQGIQRPVWKTIEDRPDDYFFSLCYWRIALEKVFVFGGVVKTPSKKKSSFIKESVAVAPDGTIPAIDVKEVLQRSIKGKKDWKLK